MQLVDPHSQHLSVLQSLEDRQAYVKEMHLLKTDLFMKLIDEGNLPLRPGVQRLIGEYSLAGCHVPHSWSGVHIPILHGCRILSGIAVALLLT